MIRGHWIVIGVALCCGASPREAHARAPACADDFIDCWDAAIAAHPAEPYYEYRAGLYWASRRGSFAPALESAERHYYAAQAKLEEQPITARDPTLERKIRMQLRLLYQQDGLSPLPWKGWQAGRHDVQLPSLSLQAGIALTNDPAQRFSESRMQLFTGDAAFANSDLRVGGTTTPGPLTDLQRWQVVRAPEQTSAWVGVALRQNVLGKVSGSFSSQHANNAHITSYSVPQGTNDADFDQWNVSYWRVIPIDPLFDLGLSAGFSRVRLRRAVEFLPQYEERYFVYSLVASLSRQVGPGRASIGGAYSFHDLPDLPLSAPGEGTEGLWVRSLYAEYAQFPADVSAFSWGSLRPYRTVNHGFAVYAGLEQIERGVGLRTNWWRSYYFGGHIEGPSPLAFQVEAALFKHTVEVVRADDVTLQAHRDPYLGFSSLRWVELTKVRLLEGTRDRPSAAQIGGQEMGEVTLVFPVSWEFALDGPRNFNPTDTKDHANDYANLSVGTELWLRTLGTEAFGGGVLFNAGYDVVEYYEIKKAQYLAHLGASLGW
ncbi:MAG TPA: hypothetical protein VL137_00770 [Polyangiaceae bacterium]|nr:hypothetical protein [Polyangiaceae bacterium]